MCGLPHTGQLSYGKASQAPHNRRGKIKLHTLDLLKHHMKTITFCLVLESFSIKLIHQKYSQHLVDHLNQDCKATVD